MDLKFIDIIVALHIRILVLTGALALAACSSSHSNSSAQKPLLGAIDAVSDMGDVTFLREEEVWSSIGFGGATAVQSVDPDQYNVNFDAVLPGDNADCMHGDQNGDGVVGNDPNECTRLTTQSINVLDDHEYIVALYGKYSALKVKVYDTPYHTFNTGTTSTPADTNMEVQFFQLAQGLGDIDVYLAAPGTTLSATQDLCSLSQTDECHALVDAGDYVLTLTAVGDPSTVYFTSQTLTLSALTRVGFIIRDGAGEGTSPVEVSEFRDQGATLLDRNATTTLRVTNAATNVGNVDVYAASNFSAPFTANLAFGQSSAYQVINPNDLTGLELDFTPAGNPSAFLARLQTDLTVGEQVDYFLVGDTNVAVSGVGSQDDFRRIATHAKLRLVNGANQGLDFYVAAPGLDNITTLSPTASLGFRSSTGMQLFAPGTYEIFLTQQGTKTIVFGPKSVDLAADGIYTAVATGTGEATSADILELDDFAK